MSRVGLKPITLPSGVTIVNNDNTVKVAGPKGELSVDLPESITMSVDDATITFARSDDTKKVKSLHGLIRALVQNAVTGVSEGYTKKLEVQGVGFKVNVSGQKLTMNLGFSHEIVYEVPAEVSVVVEQNSIALTGIDKQQVGHVAATIRSYKKPEPYKGKGIRYEGEYIIRKAGKAASGGKE